MKHLKNKIDKRIFYCQLFPQSKNVTASIPLGLGILITGDKDNAEIVACQYINAGLLLESEMCTLLGSMARK